MTSAINGYFTAVRKVYKTAFSQFVEQLIKIFFTLYMLDNFSGTGLEAACFCLIIGDVLSEFISFLISFFLYYIDTKKLHYGKNIFSIYPRILNVSFPIAITSYVRSGLFTLKQVLIPSGLEKSGLDCTRAFAEYGTISGMAMPVLLFPSIFITTFSNLLVPEFTRYYVKKDYSRIKAVTKLIFFVTALFAILLIMIFFFLSDRISLALYKDSSVSNYLKLFCPLLLIMYLDIIIDGILKGLGEHTSVMLVNIIDLTITTSFIYLFVPKLGIIGYIISIYISEVVNFSISFIKLLFLLKRH